ncbi:hypothetical protein MIR68_012209 [Amoeboaphelidium protococcarum]|nr:hypothetical protein MIR68_012209 [Amoeboaphelidium protococcarum]KAI3652759.1 hypothetical protein MP228_002184 [Amoeboaphelidium protococcarum]
MPVTITSLLYSIVMLTNAVCILSEDRFLSRIGWSASMMDSRDSDSVKYRLLTLVHAIRTLLRIPLILLNIVMILYELIAG